MFTINCKGKILGIEQPLVMGILNATPDSFYKGDLNDETAFEKIRLMVQQGASIIDVGGQSTRPGSLRIDAVEEAERILPFVEHIAAIHPGVFISVDTYHSLVAREAVQAGAHMINDVSAGNMDAEMISTVASLGVPYICMHMKGTPETMQQNPVYENILKEILDFFIAKIAECQKAGIKDVIVDPGFGFGKTVDQNFWLLKHMHLFGMLEKPLLAGLSRKSSIYKTLDITAAESLNGSTVMHTIALQNGANILRVHDVKEAIEAVALTEKYKKTAL
ncbi:MAG: dihydropteroate synthase [Ferruginibacter sp.]